MEQIDAETAVKILAGFAPSGTAEPGVKARQFLKEAAGRGIVQLRAFRGHAINRRELVPASEIYDLDFDWLARASQEDDAAAEADLISRSHHLGIDPQIEWRNVRFFRNEIEGVKARFAGRLQNSLTWVESRVGQPRRPRAAP